MGLPRKADHGTNSISCAAVALKKSRRSITALENKRNGRYYSNKISHCLDPQDLQMLHGVAVSASLNPFPTIYDDRISSSGSNRFAYEYNAWHVEEEIVIHPSSRIEKDSNVVFQS